MTIDEFQDLVDRCGERPEDWPAEIRDEAVAFLESSQTAKAVVAGAADLRAMFAAQPAERAPQDMAARIATLAGRMDSVTPGFVTRRSGILASDPAPGPAGSRPVIRPRTLLWLGVCFIVGIALGAAPAAFNANEQIDWPTLLVTS